MWLSMTMTAFDCMEEIHVVVRVSQEDGRGTGVQSAYTLVTDFAGSGETDPVEWLRDVLVAALEEYDQGTTASVPPRAQHSHLRRHS